MPVSFKELAGSPRETFGPDGMAAQRQIVVAWEDRHAMATELLGEGYAFGVVGQAAYPGRPGIVAMQVAIEPWPPSPDDQGAQDDIAQHLNSYQGKFAQLTIDYEWIDQLLGRGDLPSPQQGTWLTYRMDFGGEYLTLPDVAMRWASNASLPVPADAAPLVRVPIIEHHVTWHHVPSPPWNAIRTLTGTINQDAFLGAAAETVLFDGATAVKQFIGVDALHQPLCGWKITYVFREKAMKAAGSVFGWNHRYRPLPVATAGWDRLVAAGGQGLYTVSDFTPLFQFEASP